MQPRVCSPESLQPALKYIPSAEIMFDNKYRRHTYPNGGYDKNEIKQNKGLNYSKQNCPIFPPY